MISSFLLIWYFYWSFDFSGDSYPRILLAVPRHEYFMRQQDFLVSARHKLLKGEQNMQMLCLPRKNVRKLSLMSFISYFAALISLLWSNKRNFSPFGSLSFPERILRCFHKKLLVFLVSEEVTAHSGILNEFLSNESFKERFLNLLIRFFFSLVTLFRQSTYFHKPQTQNDTTYERLFPQPHRNVFFINILTCYDDANYLNSNCER